MRRILVHSSSNATGQAKARNKKLARGREDLEKIQCNLGTRHYPDAKKVADAVAVIAIKRRVTAYLLYLPTRPITTTTNTHPRLLIRCIP
ncbi:hypothetical protein [Streptomyces sp. NBC_01643]|uniref:hypothetical protein n=1 Tax=Streptomyces sp. NBC_01643 TaxID=2975906 RepID=UPI003870DD25|nr:hypothetical protein OHB03_44575 [Streptomyces sp. NBC_01643]